MTKGVDDRSPMAKAMSKVSEIITICLIMIIPALIGNWIDQKFSTVVLFTLLGLILGMTGAVFQLMRLVSSMKKNTDDRLEVDSTISKKPEDSHEPRAK